MTRKTNTLHEDVFTFMTISRWILIIMRNILNKIVEKIKIHILYSVTFSRKSCCLWDNVEKYDGAREARSDYVCRMRFSCWINKATCAHSHSHAHAPAHPHTHTHAHTQREICNTCCFFTTTIIPWKRLNVRIYVHYLPCCHSTSVFPLSVSFNQYYVLIFT
jgi:hypothetical protein